MGNGQLLEIKELLFTISNSRLYWVIMGAFLSTVHLEITKSET